MNYRGLLPSCHWGRLIQYFPVIDDLLIIVSNTGMFSQIILRMSAKQGMLWFGREISCFISSLPAARCLEPFNSILMRCDSPNSSSSPRRYDVASGFRKNRSRSLTRVCWWLKFRAKQKNLRFTRYSSALSVTEPKKIYDLRFTITNEEGKILYFVTCYLAIFSHQSFNHGREMDNVITWSDDRYGWSPFSYLPNWSIRLLDQPRNGPGIHHDPCAG